MSKSVSIALAGLMMFAGGAWAADGAAPAATPQHTSTPSGSGVAHYGYGTVPTAAQIAGWSIAVLPNGEGLPPGHGTVDHGADVYSEQCAACHGTFGEGVDRYPKLATDSSLIGNQPTKAVGNYWPYATTLWDYINRAMPFPAPHSLPPDDVYAITAYILNLNNIVGSDFVADQNTLPKVVMPNRNGFILKDPRPDTAAKDCMANCRDPASVKILSSAEGGDLTPKDDGSARYDEAEIKLARGKTMQRFLRVAGAAAVVLLAAASGATPANAQDASKGQVLAFDRAKGNCLACHTMKGGDVASNVGPELSGMKAKFPDAKELAAIISDEETRNPQTVMPAFGKNYILNDKDIKDIVAFLYTL